jgi:hypothetical protein
MATPVLLEPLSTGDIIDRSIRIYRQNLRPLLAAAAGPFLLGALSSFSMNLGTGALEPGGGSRLSGAAAAVLLLVGVVAYLGYIYAMVLVVAGLARSVGDHLMLGTPISLRATVDALRGRLLDLTIASLLLMGCAILIFMIVGGVTMVAVVIAGVGIGAVISLRLPEWLAGLLVAVVVLVAVALVVFVVVPVLLARVVFIPQAVMIEGASAGAAAARAFTLGSKVWYRVLAVLLFTNCTAFSIAMAVLMPIALALWMGGYLTLESEAINIVYNSVLQFSSFLLIPVWSIAYTLLYFDSRVRKEGYDVDLLVRRLPRPSRPPVPGRPPRPAYASNPAASGPVGQCPRCGRYLLASARCVGCGWYPGL